MRSRRGNRDTRLSLPAAVLLIVSLLCATLSSGYIRSPKGAHCPTAIVQTVREKVLTKTPCGCTVETVVERKLKPGDAGFQQCHCGEKKAAQTTDLQGEAPLVLALDLPFQWTPVGTAIGIEQTTFAPPMHREGRPAAAPPCPPPDFV